MKTTAFLLAATCTVANICSRNYDNVGGLIGNKGTQTSEAYDFWKFDWTAPPGNVIDPVTGLNKFPNGFRTGMMYAENTPPMCVNFPNSRDSIVSVMVQSLVPDAKICIQSQEYDATSYEPTMLVPRCDYGTVTACFPAPRDQDFNLMVTCPHCEESTGFYYKLQKSQKRDATDPDMSATNQVDMWCMMMQGEQSFKTPQEIDLTIDPSIVIPEYRPDTGDASSLAPGLVLSGLALTAIAL